MAQHPDSKIITVYEPADEAEMAIVCSLLESAGIRYFTTNVQTQSLFGMGVIGFGHNLLLGPVEIQIVEEDREQAQTIIDDYLQSDGGDESS